MKKIVSILIGATVLFGCASHQDFSFSSSGQASISTVEQISWNQVGVPSSFSIHFSEDSQILNSIDIMGPVAGFSFDVSEPQVIIELSGMVKRLEVFSPNLAIYDQNFKLLRNYDSSFFDYDKNDFIKGDVLFGEVELNLPMSTTRIYGVIYTTKQDLTQTTQLLHPAKAMAIAKRNVVPAIDDPKAKHVDIGEVRVAIKREGFFSGLTKPSKSASAPEIPVIESKKLTIEKIQPETQTYYHNAIKAAVEADNIPKALGLLDEAKALGIEGVQEVFVKAVNKK
ncbi:maltose-binding protein [Vibrio sp. HI00D65]|uniref:MalM family protein n=1 Tax=Vibrio sp. HI00D65 TaxID=1822216 RepID=UPI0007BAB8BB|nr:MalM family protein [Vibrio sp. HI00D65]KZX55871.1 maltose-binding protein [Vibrio sp. HI00D65]